MERMIDRDLTSVQSFLDKFCGKYADRDFLRMLRGKTVISYRYSDLHRDSVSLAKSLLSRGDHGKHLAVMSENRYEFVVTYFACLLAGTVFVPVDITSSPDKIAEMLSFADVDTVFHTSATERLVPAGKNAVSFDSDAFASLLKEGRMLPETSFYGSFSSDETAMLCFTSGTSSGKPKCVMLTARSLFTPATDRIWRYFAYMGQAEEPAGVYSPLPLFHLAGLICTAVNITVPNGSTFLTSPRPASFFRDVTALKPHFILAVPALIKPLCCMMEEQAEKLGKRELLLTAPHDLTSRRELLRDALAVVSPYLCEVTVCGAKTSRRLIERLNALGIYAGCDYGMTECAPQVTIAASRLRVPIESVGTPCSFNEVRITDGILFVRGENVMKGYYKNPEATREVLTDDGWFCTGDLAAIDEDGYLYIKGRATSVVVLSNGENIDTDALSARFTSSAAIDEIVILPDRAHDNDALVALIYSRDPAAVKEEVARINKTLPVAERVVRFRLADKPFEKNEMMKIKRFLYCNETV